MGVAHPLAFSALANRRYGGAFGGVLAIAGAIFGLGFAVGVVVRPSLPLPGAASIDSALAAARETTSIPAAGPASRALDTQPGYPADVVRVIDGDTFEARVRVWPGLDVNTKVRLRNIDAPELHARCADELANAQAARTALETMLAAGGVTISRVGLDKYGGRVNAAVATRDTAYVSTALLNGGWARSYGGGRRGSWR